MKKRFLAAMLLAMLLAMLSVSALADDTTIYASGTCGDNLTWTMDSKGVLTISGTGDMYDYSVEGDTVVSSSPWSKSIQSVVIKEGVTSIGSYAFEGCTVIQSVSIPDSVTKIGNNAFAYCQSLTGVTIPDSITEITESAFQCCGNLTSVTIPDSVISIGESAFRHCQKLPGITIPDSVKSIGAYAFYDDCALISVTISEGVESIGESAFENCWKMTSVTIPDSVTSIGDAAFKYCSALISVVIPDSITSIPEDAFRACSDLTSVTIPDSVNSIGASAFYGCHSLTSVTIPDGVTVINEYTFASCFSLSSVTIPDSLTGIGEKAFSDCNALLTIRIPDSVTSLGTDAFSYCENMTSAIIGNGITSVSESAFCGCSSLTSVTIPASVTSICSGAFSGCSSLTDVYISDLSAWCAIDFVYGSNPLNYASNLYLNGELVTDLVIPENTFMINGSAFESCECLKSVTVSNAFIDVNAFAECSNLTSVSLGYVSGFWDFSDSTNIEKITFTDFAPDVMTSSYIDEDGNVAERGPFYGITADAYYPADNTSWTAEIMAQIGLGANLTWIPYTIHKHSWDDGVVVTAATCTEDGVKTYTCTSCGETKTKVIPATGHTWNSGKITTAATCAADGVKTYTCTACGETKTEVIPAPGHDYSYVDNGDGTHTATCSRCGNVVTEEHNYVNLVCACGAVDTSVHIVTQPNGGEATIGQVKMISVEAVNAKAYQWYYSKDDGETWNKLYWTGAKTDTLEVEYKASRAAFQYKCRVKGNDGTILYTEPTSIAQGTAPDGEITKQPQTVCANVGETVSFSITAENAISYQWYYSKDDGTTWTKLYWDGYDSNTLTFEVKKSRYSYVYYCKITDGNGKAAYSTRCYLCQPFSLKTQPQDVTAAIGDTVNLTVSAVGVQSYQWYYSSDNGESWKKLSWTGARSDTLTVEVTQTRCSYLYHCVLVGYDGTEVTTNNVQITAAG